MMDEIVGRFEQTLPRSLGHRGELTAILSHEVERRRFVDPLALLLRPARLCIRHFDGGYG